MTAQLLLLSKLVFTCAGLGAGVRLAQMARREGGLPVHTWASAMVLIGGIGLLAYGVGPRLSLPESAASIWMFGADLLKRTALVMLACFVWKVFGAGRVSSGVVLVIVVGAIAADWWAVLLFQQWPAPALPSRVAMAGQLVFATPFLWSTAETLSAYQRARRQLALGLCDAAVANRYLLWSAGCGSFASICVLAALQEVLPAAPGAGVWIPATQSALYVTNACLVVLGFFPPAPYLRWVAGAEAG